MKITEKKNYCINCEEVVLFIKNKCAECGGKYNDVVPASYRNCKYDFGNTEKKLEII